MALKSTGGRLYNTARVSDLQRVLTAGQGPNVVAGLEFRSARARVAEVVVGRIPIADFNAFFGGRERSLVEPFINPATGNFRGLVSQLETDGIVVTIHRADLRDELSLHSVKHALLNAAPAVTGLAQDEFGAEIRPDEGEVLIYDNVLGGTGGCRLLVERRLGRWIQVVRELAECHQVQCDDACRACLFLPSRLCRRGNHDLDRRRVLQLLTDNRD